MVGRKEIEVRSGALLPPAVTSVGPKECSLEVEGEWAEGGWPLALVGSWGLLSTLISEKETRLWFWQ